MWTDMLNKENRTDAGSWMPPRRQNGHFPKYWWVGLPLTWSSVVSWWMQSYLHSSRHVQPVRRKGNDSASWAEEFGQRMDVQWATQPIKSGLLSPEEALTRTGRTTTTYENFIVEETDVLTLTCDLSNIVCLNLCRGRFLSAFIQKDVNNFVSPL